MLAVDTNVLVRYVTNDDPIQSPIAHRFVDENEVWLSWTVIVESEWVLRSAHKLARDRVLFVMRQFAGLPTVTVANPFWFRIALDWFEQGMDFADALHLAAADDCSAFATFDRKLVAAARKAKAGKVKAL